MIKLCWREVWSEAMSCLFSSLLEDLYSPSDTALCIDIKIDGSVQDCSILH